MLKPPAPTIPGMTDTLDFVKNLWGSMNIPGAGMPGMSGLATPPLSTDELDKRIADLKAVESWLNMNVTMLRGTIQAMEVQRGTLAALKSMSASMADAMRQSGIGPDKMAAMPFASFFTPPSPSAGSKPAAPAPSAAAASAAPAGGGSAQPGAAAPAGSDAGASAMGMPAAVAWWNMLQEQFTQAVTSAMSSATSNASAAPGAAASAPPAAPAAQANAAPSSSGGPGGSNAGANMASNASPNTNTNSNPGSNAGPNAGADGAAAGNGKARTPRSRADKA